MAYLGIDGGSSKTAGILLDGDGQVLASHTLEGSAFIGPPDAAARRVLRSLVGKLCRQAKLKVKDIRACGAGLNGVDFADEFAMQRREVAKVLGLPPKRLALVNDGIVALWGASASAAAVILQHGSAFTSAYRAAYGKETLFDHCDVGRGFDLRHEAVVRVARMIDGRLEPTALKRDLLMHFEVKDEAEFHELVYRDKIPYAQRLTTAPFVFRGWQQGDAVARELVEKAAHDYALGVSAMIKRAGVAQACAVFGGGVIAQAPPEFWRLLTNCVHRLQPGASVSQPLMSPEQGAAVLAFHHAGGKAGPYYERVLENK